MSNLKISQLPVTNTSEVDDVIAIVNNDITKQINKNDFLINTPTFSGNTDTLIGSTMRTIYSRTNTINYVVGNSSDMFSGATSFGSRNFPQSFFTNSVNYKSKIIHFRIVGKWGSNDNSPTIEVTTQFGSDTLVTLTIPGTQTTGANGHSLEILGEITINNGNALCCYAIGWCDNAGNYQKYALSDASTPINITGFSGGDFKLIIDNDTSNDLTSYMGYIQIWN